MNVTVLYFRPDGVGWHPVSYMARLAAELLDARFVEQRASRSAQAATRVVAAAVPRRRGKGTCLAIVPQPQHLSLLLRSGYLLRGYEDVAAWVIDSFWDDRIPLQTVRRHLDRIYVTDPDDVPRWRRACRRPVEVLMWGSDVLQLGSSRSDRSADVLRIGRQPPLWDDDDSARGLLAKSGIRYRGRPPTFADPAANQSELMSALAQARFSLAFSNLVSPAPYTHPTRDYLTARWTDSLAAGCSVVGAAPRSAAAKELLWPGATAEIPREPAAAVPVLLELLSAWTPEAAARNHRIAAARLDWRLRFEVLARDAGLDAPRLTEQLAKLRSSSGGADAGVGLT